MVAHNGFSPQRSQRPQGSNLVRVDGIGRRPVRWAIIVSLSGGIMRIGTMTLLAVALVAAGGCDQKKAAPGGASAPAASGQAAAPAAAEKPAAAAAAPAAGAATASGAPSDVLATAGKQDDHPRRRRSVGQVRARRGRGRALQDHPRRRRRAGRRRRSSSRRPPRAASRSSSSSRPRSSTRCRRRTTTRSRSSTRTTRSSSAAQSLDEVKDQIVEYLKRPRRPGALQRVHRRAEEEVPDQDRAAPADGRGRASASSPPLGPRRRAGHDHRVLRLRVPVLQARRADRSSRC